MRCSKCGEDKSPEEFYHYYGSQTRRTRAGRKIQLQPKRMHSGYCKDCASKYQHERNQKQAVAKQQETEYTPTTSYDGRLPERYHPFIGPEGPGAFCLWPGCKEQCIAGDTYVPNLRGPGYTVHINLCVEHWYEIERKTLPTFFMGGR